MSGWFLIALASRSSRLPGAGASFFFSDCAAGWPNTKVAPSNNVIAVVSLTAIVRTVFLLSSSVFESHHEPIIIGRYRQVVASVKSLAITAQRRSWIAVLAQVAIAGSTI